VRSASGAAEGHPFAHLAEKLQIEAKLDDSSLHCHTCHMPPVHATCPRRNAFALAVATTAGKDDRRALRRRTELRAERLGVRRVVCQEHAQDLIRRRRAVGHADL
jgi:hypothetical protein